MAARRSYSDEERAAALATLDANGGNMTRTARQLGIPRMSLQRFREQLAAARGDADPDAPPASPKITLPQLVEIAQVELADKLNDIAHALADAMPGKIASASLQQCAVSLGIAIEKMRLLNEQSTSNVAGTVRVRVEQLQRLDPAELARQYRQALAPPGTSLN